MNIIGPDIASSEEKQRIIAAVRQERHGKTRWNVPSWCMMCMASGFTFLWTVGVAVRFTALDHPWRDPLFLFLFWQATLWLAIVGLSHIAWGAYKTRIVLKEQLEKELSNQPSDRTR